MPSDGEGSSPSLPSTSGGRGRGRGWNRGKAQRARGRRGFGRPAEFRERLLLEGDQAIELDPDSEEAKETARKYTRRQLGSNADRYKEQEPELDSDGEAVVDPEVNLSTFLARQQQDDEDAVTLGQSIDDEDDVDRSLAHLASKTQVDTTSRFKGKLEAIEIDEDLENMLRDKEEADANRELKSRFKAKVERHKSRGTAFSGPRTRIADVVKEAPPLPDETPPKSEKGKMEDYLDDLLA